MSNSDIFSCFCVSFLLGILIRLLNWPITLLLLVFLLVLAKNKQALIIFFFCLVFFGLGLWQVNRADNSWKNNIINQIAAKNIQAEVIAIVDNDPEIGPKSQRVIIKPQEIVIKNKRIIPKSGLIMVLIDPETELKYGDKVKLKAEIVLPENFSEFDYQSYLAKDQIYAQMIWPKMEILDHGQGNWLYSKVLFFKEKCREQLMNNFSGKSLSFLRSLILGEKSSLDPELKEQFQIIGISHIMAISGDHIVMLQEIFVFLLMAIGLWRKQAVWASLLIIFVFIAMIGFQASAVRAGIMGAMYVLSDGLSRQSQGWKNLLLAATIMVALNPFILKYDPGFQLSFLAVLGIIFLCPLMQKALTRVPELGPLRLKTILAVGLSAQIFTTPISIYHFKSLSLIAPIANAFIIPVMPYLLFFSIATIFLGMIWQVLGFLASLPTTAFVYYIQRIAGFFSQFDKASIKMEINAKVIFAIYVFLGYIIFKYRKSHQFLNNL